MRRWRNDGTHLRDVQHSNDEHRAGQEGARWLTLCTRSPRVGRAASAKAPSRARESATVKTDARGRRRKTKKAVVRSHDNVTGAGGMWFG